MIISAEWGHFSPYSLKKSSLSAPRAITTKGKYFYIKASGRKAFALHPEEVFAKLKEDKNFQPAIKYVCPYSENPSHFAEPLFVNVYTLELYVPPLTIVIVSPLIVALRVFPAAPLSIAFVNVKVIVFPSRIAVK